jgi:hypothetical protein
MGQAAVFVDGKLRAEIAAVEVLEEVEPVGEPRMATQALVKVLLRDCSVEPANASRTDLLGREVACVDPDSIITLAGDALPVRNATAVGTAHELKCLAPPRVCVRGPRSRNHAYLGFSIIGPQRSVPATNGTVAVSQRFGRAWNLDGDLATVASGGDHRLQECDA